MSLMVIVSPTVTFIETVNLTVISQMAPAVIGSTLSVAFCSAPMAGLFWTGIERTFPEIASIFTTTSVSSSESTPFAGR